MTFYERLVMETEVQRTEFLAIPFLQQGLAGELGLDSYLAFLGQAYHHVRHTVPLLMACGSRLPAHLGWLQQGLASYIDEELGHEQWILEDIQQAGGDADEARQRPPELTTEVMVACAYHTIDRGHPLGFLGMVFVLEGTSVALATQAAERVQASLGLPDAAFHYLRSHGSLDQDHVGFFAALVDRLERDEDRHAVVHGAQIFYRLYGDIFRGLPRIPKAALKEAMA